jgi:membrane-bound lytic murein transglycosylase B
MIAPLFLCACLCAAAPDAGAPGYDPKKPDTWRLSAKLTADGKDREPLIREWLVPSKDPGEAALTREQADALLDDPRAQLVYADKTISIVAPSMVVRQRQQHLDLLKMFLEPERLDAGAEFYLAHREVLERSGTRHNVDPAVVVSILMWESKLGKVTGDFFAFNAFTSQAFFINEANTVALTRAEEQKLADPAKQAERVATIRARALHNLSVLVRTCAARKIDPLTVKGSWAGALGYPQFMPASLRWAEDGDGDGKIDLYTFDDSIASVANYLGEFGFAKDRQKAVWGYNHEAAYVSGVLAFADALTAQLKKQSDAGTPATR